MPMRAREVHESFNSGIGDAGRPDVGAPPLPRVAPDSRNPNDPSTWGKVARNEACPCGSGKKYKHCHGAVEDAA